MNTPMTAARSHKVMVAYSSSNRAQEVEEFLSLSSRFNSMLVEMGNLAGVEMSIPADVIIVDLQKVNDPRCLFRELQGGVLVNQYIRVKREGKRDQFVVF